MKDESTVGAPPEDEERRRSPKRELSPSRIQQEERAFRARIGYCLDSSLDNFGESLKLVIYRNFEYDYGFEKEEVPDHLGPFLKFLEGMFGSNSKIVVSRIKRQILQEFGIAGGEELPLEELVKAARSKEGK